MMSDDYSLASLDDLLATKGWQDRYKMLLQWSKLVTRKESQRLPQHVVKGCALETWLVVEETDGIYTFSVDSDSRVVKGLAVLLLLHINGCSAQVILDFDVEALMQKMELQKHLSPSRGNGFKALLDKALQLL